MPTYKGKVLFIHGYTQSASIFYAKTSALRKKLLKLGYKTIYLNAPVELTPTDLPANYASQFSTVTSEEGEERSYRAWWIKKDNTNNGIELEDSFDTIKQYVQEGKVLTEKGEEELAINKDTEEEKKLPIVGLLGFSQGAALAGLIAHGFKDLFGVDLLKFAVLYSGFKLDTSKKSGNDKYDKYFKKSGADLKFLHVYGELDTVVSEERVLSLYEALKDESDKLKHPGGHFVPNSKLLVDQVTNWIQVQEQGKMEKEPEKEDDLDDLLDMMDNIGKA